jgi:hypothetical protein
LHCVNSNAWTVSTVAWIPCCIRQKSVIITTHLSFNLLYLDINIPSGKGLPAGVEIFARCFNSKIVS